MTMTTSRMSIRISRSRKPCCASSRRRKVSVRIRHRDQCFYTQTSFAGLTCESAQGKEMAVSSTAGLIRPEALEARAMTAQAIRIIGLDPGLRHAGWGILDSVGNNLVHV